MSGLRADPRSPAHTLYSMIGVTELRPRPNFQLRPARPTRLRARERTSTCVGARTHACWL